MAMSEKRVAVLRAGAAPATLDALLRQYGSGPVHLTGNADALYERHLLFDNVADPAASGPRERYEALARSVRDVLSQRWVHTEQTYRSVNPKRVYYLSMEFLIGRSLTNHITNLLLSRLVSEAVKQTSLDWLGLLEEEPDAALGNGGLGRLAACFLDSMATMQLPAMGYGLRYEYGMFRQSIEDGWQREQSGQLAAPSRPLGGSSTQRSRGSQAQLLVRDAWRELAGRAPPLDPDRYPVRSTRGRLRRQNHQHSPIVERCGTRLFRFPGIQQRRFRRRPGREFGGPHTD